MDTTWPPCIIYIYCFSKIFSQISPITLYSLFVSIYKPALEQRLHTQKLLLTWYEFLISIKECHGLCNLWWVVLMAPHPQWFCLPRPHSNRPRSKARDRCSPASAGRHWFHDAPRCPRCCPGHLTTASRSAHLQQCLGQWPFQEPKLEVPTNPTIYKAYVRPM